LRYRDDRSELGVVVTAATFRVVIVESQVLFGRALCELISRDADFDVLGDFVDVAQLRDARLESDVMLLDIEALAFDVADAIRTARAVSNARVCALTAFSQTDVMQRCLAAGAEGYIVKTATPAEFLRAVRAVASGFSYVDPRTAGDLLRRRSMANGRTDPDELTQREIEIVCMIAQGRSNREISQRLILSEKTVNNYISRIFSKIGVTARTQAAAYAFRNGMI